MAKKIWRRLYAVSVAIVATATIWVAVAATPAYAEEDSQGFSEEGSDFSDDDGGSDDSSSSSESPSDPGPSEPSDPTPSDPGPSEPSDPTPTEPGSTDPTGPVVPSSPSSDDGGSGVWFDPTPISVEEPVPATPQPTVYTPAAVVKEESTVTPPKPKKAKKAVTKKEVEQKSSLVPPETYPYEPVAVEIGLEKEEVSTPVETGVLGEVEGAQEAPQKGFPWYLLFLLLFAALFYKPYKLVKVAEKEENNEEKSFFTIKGAAKEAAKLLDSKDFERDYVALEIYKKKDDRNDKAEKIDRKIFNALSSGKNREVVKATDAERQACEEAGLIKAETTSRQQLTAEEAAAQWVELAMATA